MTSLKHFLLCLFVFIQGFSVAQNTSDTYVKEIESYQNEQTKKFKDPDDSPLSTSDMKRFEAHEYFDIDESYRVEARFEVVEEPETFLMKTNTSRLPEYNVYGVVYFELKGKDIKLNVYKSLSTYDDPEYGDYLFFPFTDWTNGEESYATGRYIDLRIPEGNTIVIDFNKSYNPYCAYSKNYSCPIPPEDNHLDMRVEAGIRNNPLKH